MNDLRMASGRLLPIWNNIPEVLEYLNRPSSLVPTLIDQINVERMYAFAFEGKRGQVFLDLGANIGLVSLYAADSCSRIVAVEPDPNTYRILKSMVAGFNNITTLNVALAPYPGPCKFFQNDINTTASSTVNTYGTPTTVQGRTLMQILSDAQLFHVDFAKVDVEGAEGDGLSFDQLLAAKPIIKSYYIETHNCPATTWEQKLGRIVSDLSQLGYGQIKISGMSVFVSL